MSQRWRDAIDEVLSVESIDLRGLRRLCRKTQAQLAGAVGISQAQISRIEAASDYKMSSLRRHVEGLGGTVEIYIIIGADVVRLRSPQ